MSSKKLTISVVAIALIVAWSSSAEAGVSIRTNDGNGADAEVRESQGSADFSGLVTGTNRGNSTELSTRLATNRSSVSYAKFDISGLPPTADPFWDIHDRVAFHVFVRQNGNFSQLTGTNLAGDPVDLKFSVLALDPNGTYSNSRTDRSGNNYTATYNQYDWTEGDGSALSGIDFYDAPGILPHCKISGLCDDGGDGTNIFSTLGVYDDFDSNVISLGDIVPIDQYPGASVLEGGDRLTFESSGLRDVVLAAIDAGQDTVTIMVHHKGPQDDTVQSALGRNYNMTPKEHLILDAGGVLLNNNNGRFSPTLWIVPEPSSLALVCFGCFGWLVGRRRR